MYKTKLPCCIPKTNTILSINYTSIKNLKIYISPLYIA